MICKVGQQLWESLYMEYLISYHSNSTQLVLLLSFPAFLQKSKEAYRRLLKKIVIILKKVLNQLKHSHGSKFRRYKWVTKLPTTTLPNFPYLEQFLVFQDFQLCFFSLQLYLMLIRTCIHIILPACPSLTEGNILYNSVCTFLFFTYKSVFRELLYGIYNCL